MKIMLSGPSTGRLSGHRAPLHPGLLCAIALLILFAVLCAPGPAARAVVEVDTEQALADALDINSADHDIVITGDIVANAALPDVSSSFTVTINPGKTLTLHSDWTVLGGGTVNVDGTLSHRDLVVGGMVRVDGMMIHASGTCEVEPGAYLVVDTGRMISNSDFIVRKDGTFANYNEFESTATFTVENSGIFAQSASMRLSGGCVATFNANAFTGGASFTLVDDAVAIFSAKDIDISGIALSGRSAIKGTGTAIKLVTFSIEDDASFEAGSLTVQYGSFLASGSGMVMLSGDFNVESASCSVTGNASINAAAFDNGGTATIQGHGAVSLSGGLTNRNQFENGGTLTLNGGGTNASGATLINRNALTVNAAFTNNGDMFNYAGVHSGGNIVNNATLYTAAPQSGLGSAVEVRLAGGSVLDYAGIFHVYASAQGIYPLPDNTLVTPPPGAAPFSGWQDVATGDIIADPAHYMGAGPVQAVFGTASQPSFLTLDLFADAYEGYTPVTADLVVLNPGPGIVTIMDTRYGGDTDKFTLAPMQTGQLASGGSVFVPVSPVTGLLAGTYQVSMEVDYLDDNGVQETLMGGFSFTVLDPGQLGITLPAFPDADEGYAQPAAGLLSVSNPGPSDVNVTSIVAIGQDAFVFDLFDPGMLPAGESRQGHITPKAGLAAGWYQAILTIEYVDAGGQSRIETADTSFTVHSQHSGPISLTAIPDRMAAVGGDAALTLAGTGLTGQMLIIETLDPDGTLVGAPRTEVASSDTHWFALAFPPNDADGDIVYTIRVSLDGGSTWGAMTTVTVMSAISAPVSAPMAQPKKDYQNGVVFNVQQFVNVRSGPGTEYAIVGEAKLGSRLSLVEWNADETWCKVLFDDDSALGWIHHRYIRPAE